MVAPAAISDPAAVRQPRAVAERLACSTLVATTATLVALAGYLVWRRACGGLRQPLDALSLSAVGVGAVALVAALRSGWQWVGLGLAHRRGLAALLWLAPSLAVLTLLAAVSVPGTPGLGQAAAGGCVLVSEAIWLALIWRTRGRHVAVPAAASAWGRNGAFPAVSALHRDVSLVRWIA